MYFKPRIFVSSTFDLSTIRHKISNLLEAAGAEVMLYEENLTPSINPATYRQDVLEADFLIFLFDSRYGSKTDRGISGTNEEWLIVKDAKIPKHVYVKKADKNTEKRLAAFIKRELKRPNVSYYVYNDQDDLLNRIQSTIFSIAKEIAIFKLETLNVDPSIIKKVKAKSDYQKAILFLQQIEETFTISNMGLCNLLETTILSSIIQPWEFSQNKNRGLFIDEALNIEFEELLESFKNFKNLHSKFYSSSGALRSMKLEWSQSEVTYFELHLDQSSEYENVKKQLDIFIEKYFSLKKTILALLAKSDIQT
jgi:hypothetical protein